jgi:glycosyltransferase involved in cell wall biosynthesis
MSMRVLFLHDRIRTGGSERNTIDLMVMLEALGVETVLCLMGRETEGPLQRKLADSGLRTVLLDGSGLRDVRAVTRFVRFLGRERFDLVHLQDPYPAPLAVVARHIFSIPVLTTIHVQPTLAPKLRDRIRNRVLNGAVRIASDRLIVLAHALTPAVLQHFKVPAERILVIPNGLEPWPDISHRRAELRQRFGWSERDRVVLMLAVLRAGKGHADLFSALPPIRDRHPEVRVKIAGGGELLDELKARAAPLGEAVEFLGERGDILELLTAADVLVLPSESEAYPTVLLEAAMAGLPAVATDVGGSREIIDHGVTGLLVRPRAPIELASAVAMLLDDHNLAARLGQAARRKARSHFTIARQARMTLDAYSGLLAEGRGPLHGRSATAVRSTTHDQNPEPEPTSREGTR